MVDFRDNEARTGRLNGGVVGLRDSKRTRAVDIAEPDQAALRAEGRTGASSEAELLSPMSSTEFGAEPLSPSSLAYFDDLRVSCLAASPGPCAEVERGVWSFCHGFDSQKRCDLFGLITLFFLILRIDSARTHTCGFSAQQGGCSPG